MADTIHVRGEGGMVIEMSLPLPDHIEQRLAKGHLRRVNEDGSPYVDEEPPGHRPGQAPETAKQVPGLPLAQPAKNDPKDAWVGWAVGNGATPDEAEAMTKADLIEQYGTPQG